MKPDNAISDVLPNIVDRKKTLLYDRIELGPDSILPARFRRFDIPLGKFDPLLGRAKTIRDTNMILSRSLPAPMDMIISKIGVLFQPSVDIKDRDRFVAEYAFSWHLWQKREMQVPLPYAATQGFPQDLIDHFGEQTQLATGRDIAMDPVPHFERLGSGMTFDLCEAGVSFAKYLPSQCQFDISFESDQDFEVSRNLDFYVMLFGLGDFPVQ